MIWNIPAVFFRYNNPFHAGLTGSISLFKDTAYRFYQTLHGNFPSHGHILPYWCIGQCRNKSRRNGTACGRTIDCPATHKIQVDVVIRQFLAGNAAHDGTSVEHGILGHRTCRIIEAEIAFSCVSRRESHCFNFNGRAKKSGHTQPKHTPYDRLRRGLIEGIRNETANLSNALYALLRNDNVIF